MTLEPPDARRALVSAAAPVAAADAVLALVAGLVAGPLAALAVLLVGIAVLAGASAYVWRTASSVVRRWIGGRPIDPSVPAEARVQNLVDGLTANMGLPAPGIVVLDDDAVNALVSGDDPRRTVLAVTRGLLERCSRIEQEAVLAHQLAIVRARATHQRDVLAVLGALGRRRSAPAGSARLLAEADRDGLGVTRYPPGLLGALRLAGEGPPARVHPALEALLFAPPSDPDGLALRRDVIEELL